jgi:hypothetical protein
MPQPPENSAILLSQARLTHRRVQFYEPAENAGSNRRRSSSIAARFYRLDSTITLT